MFRGASQQIPGHLAVQFAMGASSLAAREGGLRWSGSEVFGSPCSAAAPRLGGFCRQRAVSPAGHTIWPCREALGLRKRVWLFVGEYMTPKPR